MLTFRRCYGGQLYFPMITHSKMEVRHGHNNLNIQLISLREANIVWLLVSLKYVLSNVVGGDSIFFNQN